MSERPWDIFKKKQQDKIDNQFVDLEPKDYINDEGFEVPNNKIVYLNSFKNIKDYKVEEIVESLQGKLNRDWFSIPAFSLCLPLSIGNQYGFVLKSAHDFTLYWPGGDEPVQIKGLENITLDSVQILSSDFGSGILTLQNKFVFRTPIGINLMCIQPPNYFIDGISSMTGVIESDNLRRDFTFNLKVTREKTEIHIKKGDWLSAFIPIPRYFVDSYDLIDANKIYSDQVIQNEIDNIEKLGWERKNPREFGGDIGKFNDSGRRYFKGIHVNKTKYKNHQKRISDKGDINV